MASPPIRVMIADPRAAARAALGMLIGTAPDIDVVGCTATGPEAVAMADRTAPDVALLDVRLSCGDGLEAIRRIAGHPGLGHTTRVLAYTAHGADDCFLSALAAGASGYVGADAEPQVLLSAIRALAAGDSWLDPYHTHRLIKEYVRDAGDFGDFGDGRAGGDPKVPGSGPAAPPALPLSTRERDVLTLVGRGCTNSEIADRLQLSPLTAKKYVSRLLAKLGARDRVQLALMAAGRARPGPRLDLTARR